MAERQSYEYTVKIQVCDQNMERQFRDRAEAEDFAHRIMNETTFLPHLVVKTVHTNIEILASEALGLLKRK